MAFFEEYGFGLAASKTISIDCEVYVYYVHVVRMMYVTCEAPC